MAKKKKSYRAIISNGIIPPQVRAEIETAISLGVPVLWFAKHDTQIIALKHLPDDSIPARHDLLVPEAFASEVQNTLNVLAEALKEGRPYDDFSDDLDSLLGTGLQARNLEAETEYEEMVQKMRQATDELYR